MTGRRDALIVAGYDYDDPGLRKLRAPAHDADALAGVLGDPRIGNFTVRQLRNEPAYVINEALEEFFADRHRDDVLLVYFSCHGVKDESGQLYLAAASTKLRRLAATGVSANFVNQQMDRTRSRRVVLLLDCCYAGAFARGLTARAAGDLDIAQELGGRGRAVITASSAMEYSFEDGVLTNDKAAPAVATLAGPSVFTGALVRGLATGAADRDGDGVVTLDELYDYVYTEVREVTPHQTPGKWVFDMRGSLHIARCPATASPSEGDPVAAKAEEPIAPSHRSRLARSVRAAPKRWAAASALAVVAAGVPLLLLRGQPAAQPPTGTTATQVASPAAAEQAAGPTLFRDDFSNRDGGWPDTGSGTATHGGYYVANTYRYWNRKALSTWWVAPTKAAAVYPVAPASVRITVTARWYAMDDSAWLGVACRVVNDADAYLFNVTKGVAHIVKMKNGGYDNELTSAPLKTVDLLHDAKLEADCVTINATHATRLVLRINGRQILEHTDTNEPLAAGTVGLNVEMADTARYGEAAFDDFVVTRP
jgi:hypothetical protein